jgi:UDP-2-acetamido-3-amino-2,3-dideoxy-glucuronate N-acetyltransferase
MQNKIMSNKNYKHGVNFKCGEFNIIEDGVEFGDNVTIGSFCHFYSDTEIGDGTVIKDYVELRPNTKIGKDCYVDSRVSASGNCIIGNNVTLRYDVIIARKVEIGDNTYVSPRVMTNNLDSGKHQIGGAKIGKNCFIGTNAVIHFGINIEDDVVIGSMSFVNKDCFKGKTYIGTPAKVYDKK